MRVELTEQEVRVLVQCTSRFLADDMGQEGQPWHHHASASGDVAAAYTGKAKLAQEFFLTTGVRL